MPVTYIANYVVAYMCVVNRRVMTAYTISPSITSIPVMI